MTAGEALPLRDIHLPPAVAWWPPAPGWWILAGVLASAALGTLFWRAWRRRTALRREALAELAAIRQRYAADRDPHRAARSLSVLGRRLAKALDPQGGSAALTGAAWLSRLDAWSGGDAFTAGSGRELAVAPYRADATPDVEALCGVFERWLRRLGSPPADRHV